MEDMYILSSACLKWSKCLPHLTLLHTSSLIPLLWLCIRIRFKDSLRRYLTENLVINSKMAKFENPLALNGCTRVGQCQHNWVCRLFECLCMTKLFCNLSPHNMAILFPCLYWNLIAFCLFSYYQLSLTLGNN